MKIDDVLTGKERLFCLYFSRTRNVRESAARAGFKVMPEIKGIRLMQKAQVRREIERLNTESEVRKNARAGLERLAFGSVSDAVRLIYEKEISPEELEQLDLFGVSEIKRGVNGGVEMKFFNRLQALEKLSALEDEPQRENETAPFYEALEKGARALYGKRQNRAGEEQGR